MANITELIKKIRSAILGKDVRESIASAIEQCYEDASKNGNANMEVSEARGDYSTLKERLNHSDLEKVSDKELNNEKEIRKNADDNLQTQIKSLASGGISAANSLESMHDTSKIYVNTNDGNWYYYNGSNWIVGGVFQSTKMSLDKNLNAKDLAPESYSVGQNFKITENIYNSVFQKIGENFKSSFQVGGISASTGEYIPNNASNYNRITSLDFENINGTFFIKLNNSRIYICIYNNDNSYNTYFLYENDFYFTFHNEYKYKLVIASDDVSLVPENYEKYVTFLKYNTLFNNEKKLESLRNIFYNNGNLDLTNFLEWEIGGVDGQTGINRDIPAYNYSIRTNYLQLKNKISVYSSFQFQITEYDENKTFIKKYTQNSIGNIELLPNEKHLYKFLIVNRSYTDSTSKNMIIDIQSVLNQVQILERLQISTLCNKKINVLGDSITSTNYVLPTWWQIIQNRTGSYWNNYGIPATAIAHTDDSHLRDYNFGFLDASEIGYVEDNPTTWDTGNCFNERVDELDATADIVIVMGGTNDNNVQLGTWDSSDTATFYGGLNSLIKQLLNKFSGKLIVFCTPIPKKNDFQENVAFPAIELSKKSSKDILNLQMRAEAIKQKCAQFSIPVIDLFNGSCINGVSSENSYYRTSTDDKHPSKTGQERIADIVQHKLESLI